MRTLSPNVNIGRFLFRLAYSKSHPAGRGARGRVLSYTASERRRNIGTIPREKSELRQYPGAMPRGTFIGWENWIVKLKKGRMCARKQASLNKQPSLLRSRVVQYFKIFQKEHRIDLHPEEPSVVKTQTGVSSSDRHHTMDVCLR